MNQSVLNSVRFVLVLVLALCGGCATKKPLPYAFSPVKSASAGAPMLRLVDLKDERAAREELNEVLELPKAVVEVLQKELQGSGLFSRVETNSAPGGSADFVLSGDLNRFEWEVPDHGRKVVTASAVSFATGGIGGVIYGSTKTDVFGYADLRLVLTAKDGRVVLDKKYSGTAKDRLTKFNCDTPKTRREIVARALKDVVEESLMDSMPAVSIRPRKT